MNVCTGCPFGCSAACCAPIQSHAVGDRNVSLIRAIRDAAAKSRGFLQQRPRFLSAPSIALASVESASSASLGVRGRGTCGTAASRYSGSPARRPPAAAGRRPPRQLRARCRSPPDRHAAPARRPRWTSGPAGEALRAQRGWGFRGRSPDERQPERPACKAGERSESAGCLVSNAPCTPINPSHRSDDFRP